ncbi:formate dehydrogenase subunit beta [Acidithiobacillus sp.]
MALQSLDIERRSATSLPEPEIRDVPEVAKLIDVTRCIGCKACQAACMEWNDLRQEPGVCEGSIQNPMDLTPDAWTIMRYSEVEVAGNLEWLIRKDGCMHCADPGCLKACPSPGAIVQYKNGIVDFHEEHCIGCGYCITGCPFNVPRISPTDHKAYKCTLCSDRVAVGLEPACIKACPTQALYFGTKTDMKRHAEARVTELKETGFTEAAVYDPAGVGGTHVMYVLQYADHPEWYQELPKNPEISPWVRFWKGAFKPLAMIGLGMVALGGFFHYVTIGPNDVNGDAEEAKKESENEHTQ